jgi:hypothetical protein
VPDHPDQEQLAAYQAGDVDRRERLDVEAHLAACPSCAELVASVGRARGSLALLEEPDLPPGLHDRLTAALESSTAEAGEADRRFGSQRSARATGSPGSLEAAGSGGSGEAGPEPRVLRPAPWYRRPAAWGAAAALLLAALVVPFLNRSAGTRTTAGGDTGGGAAQEAATPAPSAASNLPVLRVKGEVTADTVRKRLQTDPQAKAALSGAATPQATDQDGDALRSSTKTPAPSTEAPAAGQPFSPDAGTQAPSPAPEAPSAGGQPPAAGALQRQSCLPVASAAANAAIRPLAPAFFIEGTYKGRPATILVTTSTSQPDRVDLWVFPRNNCSSVLDTERVR